MTIATDTTRAAVREVAEQLANAHHAQRPVRLAGCGTWLDAGRPVAADDTVRLDALGGVIEYTPGDLVITVGAGTSLREIGEVTRVHGQWLALDPFGSDDGSIGATVATASSGPLSLGAGRVRDLVLGLSVLTSDGTPVHAGGRVVKNVAGFDLVRLATGAYGTLGAITDVSLRLHALPAVDESYAVTLSTASIARAFADMGNAALGFMALEIVNAELAASCASLHGGARREWTLVARVAGNRARADAQRALLSVLGDVHAVSGMVWQELRTMDRGANAVARVSGAPSTIDATLEGVERCLGAHGTSAARLCVTPYRGSVRFALPGEESAIGRVVQSIGDQLRSMPAMPGTVVWERLPPSCWSRVPGATNDVVSQRIRMAFDPFRVLNRGIFGEDLPMKRSA